MRPNEFILGSRYITFDRKKIRAGISIMNYNEACRLHRPLYDVLIQELCGMDYPITTKYFKYLVKMENSLFEKDLIRLRVSEKRKFLLALLDNSKVAEKYIREHDGEKCFHLLLQILKICDKNSLVYNWLQWEIYEIVINICEKYVESEPKPCESICNIYYKYFEFMSTADLPKSIRYLKKTFELALGTTWQYIEIDQDGNRVGRLMCVELTEKLSLALIKWAYKIALDNHAEAIKRGEDAIYYMKRGNLEYHSKLVSLNIYLNMTTLLIEGCHFRKALETLAYVKEVLPSCQPKDLSYKELLSKYMYLKGLYYEKLSSENDFRRMQVNILFDIAEIYISFGFEQERMAKKSLKKIKAISMELKDKAAFKKSSYLLAKLKMQRLHPFLMDLLKNANQVYCDFYRLRQWKNCCFPFWRSKHLTDEEELHPLRCLTMPTENKVATRHIDDFIRLMPIK